MCVFVHITPVSDHRNVALSLSLYLSLSLCLFLGILRTHIYYVYICKFICVYVCVFVCTQYLYIASPQ